MTKSGKQWPWGRMRLAVDQNKTRPSQDEFTAKHHSSASDEPSAELPAQIRNRFRKPLEGAEVLGNCARTHLGQRQPGPLS